MARIRAFIESFFQSTTREKSRGQSFVELALIIPILLLIVIGVVEVSMFIGRYLDMLDLTREAARFASIRDPFDTEVAADQDCSTINFFDFYWDTACVFSPPGNSGMCWDPEFCNGLNPYFLLNPETDDIVISVYTITAQNPSTGDPYVSNVWPAPNGYWAWSDHDNVTTSNGNWRRNCNGETVRSAPHFTATTIQQELSTASPENKGYVAIELYYCYEQVLNIPLFSDFVPNPIQIHVYTLMPLPAAQPTPTPKPSP